MLVCGKCAKRHDDGKALRRALKASLRKTAGKDRRKVRIIKTACVGLCPKQAIVVASAATLVDGELLLLRDERDVTAVASRLLPPRKFD